MTLNLCMGRGNRPLSRIRLREFQYADLCLGRRWPDAKNGDRQTFRGKPYRFDGLIWRPLE